MSFRLVGTALSVLGAGGASGYYMQNASAPNAVVVPVTRVAAASPVQLQAPLPVPAVMAAVAPAPVMVAAPTAPPYRITDGVYWQPRVWVGQQATHNPLTGWPLTREEKESGWVDAVPVAAAPAVVVAAAPVPPPMAMAPTYTVPAGGGYHPVRLRPGLRSVMVPTAFTWNPTATRTRLMLPGRGCGMPGLRCWGIWFPAR